MFCNDLTFANGVPCSSEQGKLIYNVSHSVDVFMKNGGVHSQKDVCIRIFEKDQCLVINLNDTEQFMFNYSREINRLVFEAMKNDQCLTITFEEFSGQIVELLNMTAKKEMFLRLEIENRQCRVVFYEKSKIKALIFLIIDLHVTSEKELISELVKHIKSLKGMNSNLQESLSLNKQTLIEKDGKLREINRRNSNREFTFYKELKQIDRTCSAALQAIQGTFENRLNAYNCRLKVLLKDLENVKHCNTLKSESSGRLVETMQELRLDNDQHQTTIESLKKQLENLSLNKHESDEAFLDANEEIKENNRKIDALHGQLKELQNDIQKSTAVIKNLQSCNDELSKDLFKANQMLVSYNKHYDNMSETNEELKEELNKKGERIECLSEQLKELKAQFDSYSDKYSSAEMTQLNTDLQTERIKNTGLEKKIREVTKLNELLSSKLASLQTNPVDGRHFRIPRTASIPHSTSSNGDSRHYV